MRLFRHHKKIQFTISYEFAYPGMLQEVFAAISLIITCTYTQ
jgi:hypothetical protein